MIAEYSVTLKNKTKSELILFIKELQDMLKEKNREINSKNGTINALQCALKERTEERDRKDNIITKQNKIIDLMSEEINETDRGYTDYCEMKIECDRNCKDCIKRYFERKSEEWKKI